jgi:hypothetical protein
LRKRASCWNFSAGLLLRERVWQRGQSWARLQGLDVGREC